jgi:hypothetical protein
MKQQAPSYHKIEQGAQRSRKRGLEFDCTNAEEAIFFNV